MRKKIEFYDPKVSISEPVDVREWCLVPQVGMTIILDGADGEVAVYVVADLIVHGDEDDFYWRLTVSKVVVDAGASDV
jgi:hypothetical protein